MGRFDGDDWGDYPNLDYGRYAHNLQTHINGAKGQQALADLEAALLALPRKRLISNEIARVALVGDWLDEEPEVCAVGAYALAKGVSMSDMHVDYSVWDRGNEYKTLDVAQRAGMVRTLAVHLSYLNDDQPWDRVGQRLIPPTPEQRYVRILAWVREHRK